MTKKQYESVIAHINDRAPVWRERMDLTHFDIDQAFLDTFSGDDGEEDFKVTAVTEVRWNYREAKIKWYLPSAVRHSLEHLERVLVHELVHVLLAPEQALLDVELERIGVHEALTDPELDQLQALMYERMELATESTARAIWRAWSVPA